MDVIREIEKGNTIKIETTFYDYNNVLSVPDSANITFQYMNGNVSVLEHVDLISDANGLFTAEWNTGNCQEGIISWVIKSPNSAKGGQFKVTVNKANA